MESLMPIQARADGPVVSAMPTSGDGRRLVRCMLVCRHCKPGRTSGTSRGNE